MTFLPIVEARSSTNPSLVYILYPYKRFSFSSTRCICITVPGFIDNAAEDGFGLCTGFKIHAVFKLTKFIKTKPRLSVIHTGLADNLLLTNRATGSGIVLRTHGTKARVTAREQRHGSSAFGTDYALRDCVVCSFRVSVARLVRYGDRCGVRGVQGRERQVMVTMNINR